MEELLLGVGVSGRRPVLSTIARRVQQAHPGWTREQCLVEARAQWTYARAVSEQVRRLHRPRISG